MRSSKLSGISSRQYPCSMLALPISTASATLRASPVWMASGRCWRWASSETARTRRRAFRQVVGDLVAPVSVFDAGADDLDGVGHVAGVAGMDGQRQVLEVGHPY